MISIELIDVIDKTNVFNIYDNNLNIGSIELMIMNDKQVYIENIHLHDTQRGKGYLRKIVYKIIEEFTTPNGFTPQLICLPLPCHVPKFEKIGFTFYRECLGDKYYKLV